MISSIKNSTAVNSNPSKEHVCLPGICSFKNGKTRQAVTLPSPPARTPSSSSCFSRLQFREFLDSIFVISSSLHTGPGVEEPTRRLSDLLKRSSSRQSHQCWPATAVYFISMFAHLSYSLYNITIKITIYILIILLLHYYENDYIHSYHHIYLYPSLS